MLGCLVTTWLIHTAILSLLWPGDYIGGLGFLVSKVRPTYNVANAGTPLVGIYPRYQ